MDVSCREDSQNIRLSVPPPAAIYPAGSISTDPLNSSLFGVIPARRIRRPQPDLSFPGLFIEKLQCLHFFIPQISSGTVSQRIPRLGCIRRFCRLFAPRNSSLLWIIDLLTESRKEDRVLKGNIPASDHRRYLFPEEIAPFYGRTVGNRPSP